MDSSTTLQFVQYPSSRDLITPSSRRLLSFVSGCVTTVTSTIWFVVVSSGYVRIIHVCSPRSRAIMKFPIVVLPITIEKLCFSDGKERCVSNLHTQYLSLHFAIILLHYFNLHHKP